jgi:peptide/nickel transport system ATP-binding protein/oligopeptide transport system ATP-binding protein
LAQDICAKVVPPLMQVGKRHKVACHFAGEIGKHPTEPVFAPLLGVDAKGDRDPGATPAEQAVDRPGFDDTWFDLESRTIGTA